MKLLIPTLGTRGDVQPYLALAQGLATAGHEVLLATHPSMGELVRAHGVPFAPIGPDVDIGLEAARIRGNSRHWLLGMKRTMDFALRITGEAHQELLALCKGQDVIIVSHTAAGSIEADQLGLPKVSVSLFTQAIPRRDPSQGVVSRGLTAAGGQVMGLLMTRPYNKLRRSFGVKPLGPDGNLSPLLNLIPISPQLQPRDPLWVPQHQVTGYWFTDDPVGWQPDAALLEFLDRGGPIVAVSLGAMSLSSASHSASVVAKALHAAGLRAVVQGWQDVALPDTPDIYRAGSLPHRWLFSKVQAVIHHGGFGTTAATLRAGLSAVVIPHVLDQFYWGKRVEEIGCGRSLPFSKLNPEALTATLHEVTADSAMTSKAAEIGNTVRSETGVENAVRLIEAVSRGGSGAKMGTA